MDLMQLSKGPKSLIVAILTIVISLWKRSQKAKTKLALTNIVVSKASKVSTVSEAEDKQSREKPQHKENGTEEEKTSMRTPTKENPQDAEVFIGDKVLYSDGQEGVIEAFDDDGDLKVRKLSDGSSANWYAEKCSKAEIKVGDFVRYICGAKAHVDGFDPDGDVIVKKPNGSTATWYRSNTTGGPITMSKKDLKSPSAIPVVLVDA